MKKTHQLPALAFLLVPICTQGWSRANLLPLSGSVAHFLHLLFARYPSCYEREAGKINLLGLVCTWKHCPCPNPSEECRGHILSPDTSQKGVTGVRLCRWQQVKGMWIMGTWLGGCGTFPVLSPQILSTASSSAYSGSEQSPSLLLSFSPAKDHTALPANDYSSGQHQSEHTRPQCPHSWPKIKVRWDRHQSPLTLMGRAAFASSCCEALQLVSCSRWSTAQLSLQFSLEIYINAAQNMANLTSLSCMLLLVAGCPVSATKDAWRISLRGFRWAKSVCLVMSEQVTLSDKQTGQQQEGKPEVWVSRSITGWIRK